MKKRCLSLVLTVLLAIVFVLPSAAAESPNQIQTYEQRVAEINANYNISYQPIGYIGSLDKDAVALHSLDSFEFAIKRLGGKALNVIRSRHQTFRILNYNLTYSDSIFPIGPLGTQTGNLIAFRGMQEFSTDLSTIPGQGPGGTAIMNKQNLPAYSSKYAICEIFYHELAHTYDESYLQGGGTAIVKQFRTDFNFPQSYDNGTRYYSIFTNPEYRISNSVSITDAKEEFVCVFSWMLVSEEKFTDKYMQDYTSGSYSDFEKLSTKHPLYELCARVYNQMLKDFGAESHAVKRVAWFLDKEIPTN